MRNYRLDQLVGPIVQVEAGFTDVMAAYADPRSLLDAFTAAARRAIARGRERDRAGRGAAERVPRRPGRGRVDDVPVLDSLGTCVPGGRAARRPARPRDPGCSRRGFFGAQPARELVDAARAFYGVGGAVGVTARPVDLEVDVAVAGGGAGGVMTALRAALDADLVIAVFEKSTREGCNAAISSGRLAAGGTRFQRDGRHRGLPAAARRRHPRGER